MHIGMTYAPVASEIRSPSRPSIATSAKSLVFDESRAAVNRTNDVDPNQRRRTITAPETTPP